ncbi:MAG: hypothetical protein R3236_05305, partial [Phycisphaeraceae bacterium]|nr:hypothetical protein [Phycisphaeraceae bacterium]
ESAIFGSVAVNYHISGAPVDELVFDIPAELGAVEIVGRDVRSVKASDDKTRFTVKLNRKVMGDYNLGVFYNRRYRQNIERLRVGDIQCVGVESQTGFVTIASHLNLQLKEIANENLLAIKRQEIPSGYRMLAAAPVLKTYKYVEGPHRALLNVEPFERGRILPVVIEVMQLDTRIGVDQEDRAESTTRVRYKITNTSAQHLSLRMPPGTHAWWAYLVRRDGDREIKEAVTVTEKTVNDQRHLMVPLPRRRNPNQPITIELAYGQSHGSVGFSPIGLTAPMTTQAESTYAGWRVEAEGRAVLPVENGSMPHESRRPLIGSLSRLMTLVGLAWTSAIERFFRSQAALLCGVLAVGVLGLVFFVRRSALGVAAVLLALIGLSGLGALAAESDGFLGLLSENDNLSVLRFAQPLNFDASEPLQVEVALRSASMQYASILGVLALVGIGFVTMTGAWWLASWRRALAVSIGTWAWVAAFAQFGVVRMFGVEVPVSAGLGHLLTWGLPLVMLLTAAATMLWRLRPAVRLQPAAAVLVGVMGLGLVSGCASGTKTETAASDIPDRMDLAMAVEKDHVRIDYAITVHAAQPLRFRLAPGHAIVMTDRGPTEQVRLYRDNGFYWVGVDRAGSYELALQLLLPLAPAGEDLARQLTLPAAPALSGQVRLSIPQTGLQVEAPQAIRLEVDERKDRTDVEAVWSPGRPIRFAWKPRVRQVEKEQTRFYADTSSFAFFDTASVEGMHLVQLQIAQGQMERVRMKVPGNMLVTRVNGADLGVWNFDPKAGSLEVVFKKPVSGRYLLGVMTQINAEKLPWTTSLTALRLEGAERQSGAVGLVAGESVFLEVGEHPRSMNGQDLVRRMSRGQKNAPRPEIQNAYHLADPTDRVEVTVRPMQPELHVQQDMLLDVGEERVNYKGQLKVHVAKASIFDLELKIPAEFDIDLLQGQRIRRHWDEREEGGVRHVKLYFTGKLRKTTETIHLNLSRPVSHPIAEPISVPKVRVTGAAKRRGLVRVTGIRGLRLSAGSQSGLSELDPAELSLPASTLVFKVLGPAWSLAIRPEPVEPRIAVESVHTAEVSDARVRHVHRLRYRMSHAGVKVFQIQLPKNTLTPSIFGADIVHRREVTPGSGLWRIELAKKYYGRYSMTVRYETRFDMAAGKVDLEPVVPVGTHRYNGFVVVKTTDRV